MQLLLCRTLWGVEEPLEQCFPHFKAVGYGAIEAILPAIENAKPQLKDFDFELVAGIFTGGRTRQEHLESFQREAETAAIHDPILINCHAGLDEWSFEESVEFFGRALEISKGLGIPVAFETHRGRVLYNPWITSRLLDALPGLRLCCDLSHWVSVAERLIFDQEVILEKAARHCIHIHARVGYEQGPQVPDPRAAEYQPQVAAFEGWWKMIWQAQQQSMDVSTVNPEYGPVPYLQTKPHTLEPLANLNEVVDWQARRIKALFEQEVRSR